MTAPMAHNITEQETRVVNIVMLTVTVCIVVPRLVLSYRSTRRFGWDDGWLLIALVLYIGLPIIYLVTLPALYRLIAVSEGIESVYADVVADVLFVRKMIYAVTFLFLLVVWTTKFSLLSFYKQLLTRLNWYIRIWWATVVFCALTLIACFFATLWACKGGPKKYLSLTGCVGDGSDKTIVISFWFIYAADIVTTLMVMLLPLGVIKQSQMPLRQKLSIGALFCLGFACIVFATIRTKWVNSAIVDKYASGISALALWGCIEAAMALIIASAPGLYREVKNFRKKQSSLGTVSHLGTQVPSSRLSSKSRKTPSHREISLPSLHSRRRSSNFAEAHIRPANHESSSSSSQENLARPQDFNMGAIHVTRSVGIDHADRDWNTYHNVSKSWEDSHFRAV